MAIATPVPPEPAATDAGAITLMFRFPDGSRVKRRFLASDAVEVLFSFAQTQPQSAGKPVTSLSVQGAPPRPLAGLRSHTLGDVGLKQDTVMVQW